MMGRSIHCKAPVADPIDLSKQTAPEKGEPLTPQQVNSKFAIPAAIAQVKQQLDRPYDMGVALGMMRYHLRGLVATHLDNARDFQNKVPKILTWTSDFTEAVDKYLAYLRLTSGCTVAFPEFPPDRKTRCSRRKYLMQFTRKVATEFEGYAREQPLDIILDWNKEQTQLFNKGVDKALSDLQWIVYPENNVMLAGHIDWATWLRSQCDELGMVEARAGRHALEDMVIPLAYIEGAEERQ